MLDAHFYFSHCLAFLVRHVNIIIVYTSCLPDVSTSQHPLPMGHSWHFIICLLCWSVFCHLGSCHSFFLQHYICPICEGKQWCCKPYQGPNKSRQDSLSISLSDHPLNLSFSMESTLNQDSVSFYTAKSFKDHWMEDQSQQGSLPGVVPTIHTVPIPPAPLPVFLPTTHPTSVLSTLPQVFLPTFCPVFGPSATIQEIPPTLHPASVPSHFLDASESTIPVRASSSTETV